MAAVWPWVTFSKRLLWGFGDSLIGEVFAAQARGSEFDAQNPGFCFIFLKLRTVAHICNYALGKYRQADFWGSLASQSSYPLKKDKRVESLRLSSGTCTESYSVPSTACTHQ